MALVDWLTFWVGFESELRALAVFAVGVALYGLFIYFFYEYLSKRDLLGALLGRPTSLGKRFIKGVQYVLLFPVVSFMFFVVLAFSFFFLSGITDPEQILLVSMVVVTSVRISAYISENTAHDIAKLLPLALLGFFLVGTPLDVGRLRTAVENFQTFFTADILTGVVLRYFIFLIVVELILRVIYTVVRPGGPPKEPQEPAKTEEEPAPSPKDDPRPVEDFFEERD